MAQFTVTGGVDPLLSVHLTRGETIYAESNAMVAMDGHLSLKGRAKGGFFSSIARKVANDESFFQQEITADSEDGTVLLAPTIPGDVQLLNVGERQYRLSDGAFLASSDTVHIETVTQGIGKALFAGSGGFFVMQTSGRGELAVSGFGSIREMSVPRGGTLIVDNGHLVAWDRSLEYELTVNTSKSGIFGRLLHSQTTGEGIVLKFRGEGKVLVCSRNKGSFLDWILGQMPGSKSAQNQ